MCVSIGTFISPQLSLMGLLLFSQITSVMKNTEEVFLRKMSCFRDWQRDWLAIRQKLLRGRMPVCEYTLMCRHKVPSYLKQSTVSAIIVVVLQTLSHRFPPLLFFCLVLSFWNRVLLCLPGWSGTCYVDQDWPWKLRDLPASVFSSFWKIIIWLLPNAFVWL